jgi:hypothetical protein
MIDTRDKRENRRAAGDSRRSAAGSRGWVRGVAGFVAAAMVAAPSASLAQPSDLADLVYQADEYASRELPARGYVLTHSDVRDHATWHYWWKSSTYQCARLTTSRGKVTDARLTDEHDCDQRSAGSAGMSDGAKVAVAAAAILGVAALAHKSHERDQQRSQQSPQDVAEFERGYRDGLYAQGYHNYNNRNEYSDGYRQGSDKRASETSYRSTSGKHSGYAPYVNVQDLVGARASSLEGEMRRRGFVDKGGYKSESRAFSNWWNASTRQCMQAVVGDGRVERINSLYEGNCL